MLPGRQHYFFMLVEGIGLPIVSYWGTLEKTYGKDEGISVIVFYGQNAPSTIIKE